MQDSAISPRCQVFFGNREIACVTSPPGAASGGGWDTAAARDAARWARRCTSVTPPWHWRRRLHAGDTEQLIACSDDLFKIGATKADAGLLVALLLCGMDQIGSLANLQGLAPKQRNALDDVPICIHLCTRGVLECAGVLAVFRAVFPVLCWRT